VKVLAAESHRRDAAAPDHRKTDRLALLGELALQLHPGADDLGIE
jgi:hypothetical protein